MVLYSTHELEFLITNKPGPFFIGHKNTSIDIYIYNVIKQQRKSCRRFFLEERVMKRQFAVWGHAGRRTQPVFGIVFSVVKDRLRDLIPGELKINDNNKQIFNPELLKSKIEIVW